MSHEFLIILSIIPFKMLQKHYAILLKMLNLNDFPSRARLNEVLLFMELPLSFQFPTLLIYVIKLFNYL